MTTQGDDLPGGSYSEAWRARVAADLQAYRAEQQQLFGGINEMMLARYEAGTCTAEEQVRVEQAMRDHPALCECMETARKVFAKWQAEAPSPVTKPLPAQPGSRKRWRRLVPLISLGSAAAFLIGLLAWQQAITSGELARSQTEVERLREQNAAINTDLADRESENAHLRQQAADAEASLEKRLQVIAGELAKQKTELESLRKQNATISTDLAARKSDNAHLRIKAADADYLRGQLQDAKGQLEALRAKPAEWPPNRLLLTGTGSVKEDKSEKRIDFLAALWRRPEGQYVGFFLPIGKDVVIKPFEARADLSDERTIMFRFVNVELAWPGLTKPDGKTEGSPPTSTRLEFDVRTSIFTGTIGTAKVHGKISF